MNAKNTVRLNVECLETRNLMAAALTATLTGNGLLAIAGTEQSDVIVVRQINSKISVDGVNGSWNAGSVKGVVIDAKGGNDTVLCNSEVVRGQQAINVSTVILGGAGNDTMVGSAGKNLMLGGDGDDQIWGNAQSDIIYGGNSDDRIYGGSGDDSLFGQEGADTIYGDAGNDGLDGGNGYDYLYGQAGKDRFYDDYRGATQNAFAWEDTTTTGHLADADQLTLVKGFINSLPAALPTTGTITVSIARSASGTEYDLGGTPGLFSGLEWPQNTASSPSPISFSPVPYNPYMPKLSYSPLADLALQWTAPYVQPARMPTWEEVITNMLVSKFQTNNNMQVYQMGRTPGALNPSQGLLGGLGFVGLGINGAPGYGFGSQPTYSTPFSYQQPTYVSPFSTAGGFGAFGGSSFGQGFGRNPFDPYGLMIS